MGERVKTRDIKRELEEFAERIGCPVDELDFDVISFELVGPEDGKYNAEIEIEIGLKTPGLIKVFDCVVEVEDMEKTSRAYLKVLPTFRMDINDEQFKEERCELTQEQEEELFKETLKILLLNGVIYGHIPRDKLLDKWEEALFNIYAHRKPYKFIVAEGKPPKDPFRREVYFIPLVTPAGKVINERTGRINFKDRGYSDRAVSAGDRLALVEFIPGEYGIRVDGSLIPYTELDPLPFEVDKETIKIVRKEDKNRIIFELFALKDGYVSVEEGKFRISEYVKEKSVDYSTGSIVFDEASVNIEITGEGEGSFIDAVKDGFELISPGKKVVVKGNVGRKALVEGGEVIIEGLVAKDAVIRGKICKVSSITDATIEAEDTAYVGKAFSSKIKSSKVFADMLSGSKVYAEKVVALKVIRHSALYAYDFIMVELGEDFNHFILSGDEVPMISMRWRGMEQTKKALEKEKDIELHELKKIEKRIESTVNLAVGYMKPVFKDKTDKLKALIVSLLNQNNIEKLNELMQKLPSHVRATLSSTTGMLNKKQEILNRVKEIEDRIKEVEKRLEKERNKPGIVCVLDRMIKDNVIRIRHHKRYFTDSVKGPIAFYDDEDALLSVTDADVIADIIKNRVDENFILSVRDFLLDKGLRVYVTKLKL